MSCAMYYSCIIQIGLRLVCMFRQSVCTSLKGKLQNLILRKARICLQVVDQTKVHTWFGFKQSETSAIACIDSSLPSVNYGQQTNFSWRSTKIGLPLEFLNLPIFLGPGVPERLRTFCRF